MIKGTRNFLGTTGFVRFGVSTIAKFCPADTKNAKFFCRENRFSRENRKKIFVASRSRAKQKSWEKLAQRRRDAKVFERFLNKRSVPLRIRENLLKKTSRLSGLARKKTFPRGKSPRERALSFKRSYRRRRRDTTSANAPTPAINPNADGSGIAIPLEINASVSDLIFPRNATSPRYFFVSYFS